MADVEKFIGLGLNQESKQWEMSFACFSKLCQKDGMKHEKQESVFFGEMHETDPLLGVALIKSPKIIFAPTPFIFSGCPRYICR